MQNFLYLVDNLRRTRMRMIVGVDSQFLYQARMKREVDDHYPFLELRDYLERNGDQVLDMYAPVIRYPPRDSSPAEILDKYQNYTKVAEALAWNGLTVIECPSTMINGE